jgi:hypothetical protein
MLDRTFLSVFSSLADDRRGKYDESYIDYTIAIIRKCREYGFRVCKLLFVRDTEQADVEVISPHQDVFSRFISGSGAPYWAIEAVGLNARRMHQTGSAVIHSEWATKGLGGEEGIKAAKEGKVEPWPDSKCLHLPARRVDLADSQ